MVALGLHAHGRYLVIALHVPRALGSSGRQPETPADRQSTAFSDGLMPGDNYSLPGLLPVPCGAQTRLQERTGSTRGHRGHWFS